MKPCPRVGVELSWRCNWDCKTCFYHFDDRLHKKIDNPWAQTKAEIDGAKARGCDHVVAVGWGEPAIAPTVEQMITYAKEVGMTSSIITNGAGGLARYQRFYELGLDHLHVSCHGLGDVLNEIADSPVAYAKQSELKTWLKESGKPWRSNTTLQVQNYKQLPELVDNLIDHNCRHIVLLGFLPHYAWNAPEKMRTVAVHPEVLQPILEECIDKIVAAGRMTTLRYHPFCFLRPQYWKYVTNARYVMFDPWEWDYGNCSTDVERVWKAAKAQGDGVAVHGQPCAGCALQLHCGGWNRHYVGGMGIQLRQLRIDDVLPNDRAGSLQRGYFHDQNPANQASGHFGETDGR